eukprot:1652321-Rhodomonas_salina.2
MALSAEPRLCVSGCERPRRCVRRERSLRSGRDRVEQYPGSVQSGLEARECRRRRPVDSSHGCERT